MSVPPMARREFLLSALAACGTPLLAGWGCAVGRDAASDPVGAAGAASTYLGTDNLRAARTLGGAYLRHLGAGSDPHDIVMATAGVRGLIDRGAGHEEAIAELLEAVRGDFLESRCVELEGWILSRTELELCALTLLHAEGGVVDAVSQQLPK